MCTHALCVRTRACVHTCVCVCVRERGEKGPVAVWSGVEAGRAHQRRGACPLGAEEAQGPPGTLRRGFSAVGTSRPTDPEELIPAILSH